MVALATVVHNEALRVRAMLDSCLGVIDHLIAIDQGSTDDSLEVIASWAREHGIPKRLDTQPRLGFSEASRPRVTELLKQVNPDWMLYLDADEQLSTALNLRLRDLSGFNLQGYVLRRRNHFLNPDGSVFMDSTDDCQLRLLRWPCAEPSNRIHTSWTATPTGLIVEELIHVKSAREIRDDIIRYETLIPGCTLPYVGGWNPEWLIPGVVEDGERSAGGSG